MKYHEQLKLRKNHISKRHNKNDGASVKEAIDQWFLIFKLALGVGFVVFGLFLFSLFKKYHFFIGSSDISSSSGGFFALILGGSLMMAFLSVMNILLGVSILNALKFISKRSNGSSVRVTVKNHCWTWISIISIFITLIVITKNLFPMYICFILLFLHILHDICKNSLLLNEETWLPKFINIPLSSINYLIFLLSFVFLGIMYINLTNSIIDGILELLRISFVAGSVLFIIVTDTVRNKHIKILLIIMMPLVPILFSNNKFEIIRAIGSNVIIYNINKNDNSFYNAIKIDRKCYEDNSVVLRSNSFMFNFDTDGYYMKPDIESNYRIDLVDLMGTKIIARYKNEESTAELKIINLVNLSKCDLVQAVKYEPQNQVNEFVNIWGKYTKTLNDKYCNLYVAQNYKQNAGKMNIAGAYIPIKGIDKMNNSLGGVSAKYTKKLTNSGNAYNYNTYNYYIIESKFESGHGINKLNCNK